MSRRRLRRRTQKPQRHRPPEVAAFAELAVVRQGTRVQRLAYTRTQAAQALGISTSTFNRRVLPFIDTVEMPWGTRLVPVDELERLVAERRQPTQAERSRPARPGRKVGVPPEIVARIQDEHANGKSFGEIARGLNTDRVNTSQGGQQWWPSTVRAVIIRPSPLEIARASAD